MMQPAPAVNPQTTAGMQHHLQHMRNSLANTATAVQRLTDLIGEQRLRLHAVLSTLPQGMILLDSNGSVMLINELAHQLLDEIEAVQGDDRPTLTAQLYYKIRSENIPSITQELYSPGTVYKMVIKRFHPHSPLERYAIYIKKEAVQHPGQDRSINHFMLDMIAALAHEINNPLTPILALTSPAMRMGDEYDRPLETIYQAGNRIAGIISQMLTLETAMRNQAPQTFDLETVLRQSIEEHCYRNADTQVIFNSSTENAQCRQPQEAVKILIDFLITSIKNQRGESSLKLSVELEQRDRRWILAIRETASWPEPIERASHAAANQFADFYGLLAESLCRQTGIDFNRLAPLDDANGYWVAIPIL